jgi:dTDP-4-dehydrorhamnose reductase
MVAEKYGKSIDVEPYEEFVQNRSLNSDRFRTLTGYVPPAWPALIDAMYRDYEENREQQYRR